MARHSGSSPQLTKALPLLTGDRQIQSNTGGKGETATTLARAYYLTQNESYAAGAASVLRTWFLDASTAMRPNLNYGAFVPGFRVTRARAPICVPDAAMCVYGEN